MIGQLNGVVIEQASPHLVLDVKGVGYEIEATLSTFESLPLNSEPVLIYTHLAIRDDAHVLFGFSSKTEKKLFRELLKVNGVGAKMGLAILSGMSAQDFSSAVEMEDVQTLVKLPGVGKKTAQRLIVEMKDRLAKMDLPDAMPSVKSVVTPRKTSAVADAVTALETLGYKQAEALRMVRAVNQPDLASDQLIRAALQASISQ